MKYFHSNKHLSQFYCETTITGNGWLYLLKRPLLDILPSQVKETNLFCKRGKN